MSVSYVVFLEGSNLNKLSVLRMSSVSWLAFFVWSFRTHRRQFSYSCSLECKLISAYTFDLYLNYGNLGISRMVLLSMCFIVLGCDSDSTDITGPEQIIYLLCLTIL